MAGFMVIETEAVVEPAEFEAVIVKVVCGKADEGVPEIAPVPEEKGQARGRRNRR